jgi:gentisate 1,2-dioxygenase
MTRYDELMALRDAERQRQANAQTVVRGAALPWEDNPQGRMKWYMHPNMEENVLRTLLFVVQEIPPGETTGTQRTPGGVVGYVWRGKGATILDGERFEWEAGDALCIPIRTGGVTVQYENTDPEQVAHLLLCEPNLIGALGVDRGWGLEQLEASAPRPGESAG